QCSSIFRATCPREHPGGSISVRRFRLYPALLLLGVGLLGLRGWGTAQGSGDGSPYPPPNTNLAGRPIIASGQPIATNQPRSVVQFNDQPMVSSPAPAPPTSAQTPLDESVPPVPHPPGVKPVVPVPDDGLWSQRKLRKLPPPTQTLGTP